VTADDVGVKAVDDYTLEVTLTAPTDYLGSLMSFYHFHPVKQSAVEAAGGEDGTWASNPELVVSNGAFKLVEYTIGEGMKLVKNPEFWNADAVKIDEINVAFLDDANTAYAAYQAGDFDFIPDVPVAEVPRLIEEDPNFYVFPLLGTYYYNFNMDLDIWKDVRVRKAFALAIDRQAIVDTLAAGQVPAAGFVPPGFKDDQGRDFFETSGTYGLYTDGSGIAEAQALMAEAGYPNGAGFPEFEILYNTSEGHQTVAELVQEQLKTNLGVNSTLANQEWAVFQDTRTQGNYEMARGGWLTDFMDPSGMLAIFQDGNSYNDPNYFNADFEAAMAAALAATDKAEHFAKLYEAQTILMTDMPIIPVYHYSDVMLASERLVGWDRSVLGGLDFTTASIVD
jgi:oligopeptide transport system substrate-binding protein